MKQDQLKSGKMKRAILITTLFTVALLASLLVHATFPISALAATEVKTKTLQMQIQPMGEENQTFVFLNVSLPHTTKLPAVVQVPLPDNAEVFWVGEIMGDNPENDKKVEYEIKGDHGVHYVEFTLTNSFEGQVETTLGETPRQGNKILFDISIAGMSPEKLPFLTTLRLPTNAGKLTVSPETMGEPQDSGAGEKLYTLATSEISSEATVTVSGSYETTGSGSAGNSNASNSNLVPIVVVIAVLLIAFVVGAIYVRNRAKNA